MHTIAFLVPQIFGTKLGVTGAAATPASVGGGVSVVGGESITVSAAAAGGGAGGSVR